MLPSDIRNLQEAYQNIYEESDLLTDDLIEEIVEELVEECLEFGYTLDESADAVEAAAILYIDEAKVTYGSDTISPEDRRTEAKSRLKDMKASKRKAAVKGAVDRVKSTAKGVKAAAGIAGSIAKDEVRRAGRTASHAVQKKKAEVKGGIKKMIGGGLRAAAGGLGKIAQKAAGAASKLGEEVELDENRRMARDPEGRNSGHSKQPDPSKPGFTGVGNMSIAQIAKMSAKIGKDKKQNEEVEIHEAEGSYGQTPNARQKMGALTNKRRNTPASEYPQRGAKKTAVKSAEKHLNRMGNPDAGDRSKKSTKPDWGSGKRKGMTQSDRDHARGEAEYGHTGYDPDWNGPASGPGGKPKGKKAERQKKTGVSAEGFVYNNEVEIYDIVLEYLMSEGHADTIAEAEYIMTELDSEMVDQIVETRLDPRGRPASGPMNVYSNPKKPSQAHSDAVKAYDAAQKKKTPEQRKAELDAYKERQMNR